MKRTRGQAFGPSGGGVRKIRKGNRNAGYSMNRNVPARAYANSRVPLASRGYRYNTAERKVYDLDATIYDADTSSRITALCTPQLGTDMTNRVGRKILVKSVQVRGLVRTERSELLTAAQIPAQMCRYMILVDMQPNGALPNITDVLKTANPVSPMNLNNRDRFRVLLDKSFTLDPWLYNTTASTALASASNQIKYFKKYIKCNQEMIFNATNGGTVADITSGNIFQIVLGNQAVSATNTAEMVIATRVRFLDS